MKKGRDRTARREGERAARKRVRAQQALAGLGKGGAADRPIEVVSSSVIEVRARSLRCPLCQGSYRIDEHAAVDATLRRVGVACQRCAIARPIWFRITAPQSN